LSFSLLLEKEGEAVRSLVMRWERRCVVYIPSVRAGEKARGKKRRWWEDDDEC
jgi:hypothetical protein